MLDETHPEAVVAFGSVYEHLAMVEACAPRGIHVMVEKPLAVSVEHALQMERLVKQHSIHLLTNYETTWYASNHTAYEMINDERRIGDIRKIVVCDGHQGPQELGVPPEFLAWLTDPLQNGGGALIDFGCYGANLITWLMHGVKPVAVTAVTQQIKPDIYPNVDDEATIILTYPQAQGIIQASWNWPVSRKDIAVYGQTGYVKALNKNTLQLRENEQQSEHTLSLEPRPAPLADPFAYLAGVVRGLIEISDTDLSSLANNLTVVRILEAARHSAQLGKTILLETSEK
jgi:predicted dehydrogenase